MKTGQVSLECLLGFQLARFFFYLIPHSTYPRANPSTQLSLFLTKIKMKRQRLSCLYNLVMIILLSECPFLSFISFFFSLMSSSPQNPYQTSWCAYLKTLWTLMWISFPIRLHILYPSHWLNTGDPQTWPTVLFYFAQCSCWSI